MPPSFPADPASSDRLQVSVEHDGAHCVLALEGQLDLATCTVLDSAVEQSLAGEPDLVRMELGQLEFMDSTGLRSLLQAVKVYADASIQFELTRSSNQVQRLFELTDVAARLPFVD